MVTPAPEIQAVSLYKAHAQPYSRSLLRFGVRVHQFGDHDGSDDEVGLQTAQLPSALPPVPVAAVQPLVPAAAALPPGESSSRPIATQPQTWPGHQVRATQNK
jgi:hypothetical protein